MNHNSVLAQALTLQISGRHVWPTGGDVVLSESTTQFVAVLYHNQSGTFASIELIQQDILTLTV